MSIEHYVEVSCVTGELLIGLDLAVLISEISISHRWLMLIVVWRDRRPQRCSWSRLSWWHVCTHPEVNSHIVWLSLLIDWCRVADCFSLLSAKHGKFVVIRSKKCQNLQYRMNRSYQSDAKFNCSYTLITFVIQSANCNIIFVLYGKKDWPNNIWSSFGLDTTVASP